MRMHLTQRRLPHLNTAGQPHFVTFRLYGLPTRRHFPSDTLKSGRAFAHLDRLLDSQSAGPRYLQMPCMMPTRVHLLMTPLINSRAHAMAQRRFGAGTPFWQHENYDRLVRDVREFRRIENYMVQNPVRAGLAASPVLYRSSSA